MSPSMNGARHHVVAPGQVGQVKDHEGEQERSRIFHGTRRIARPQVAPVAVALGPGRPLLQVELSGEDDMDGGRDDQSGAKRPDQGRRVVQQVAVPVDGAWPFEEEQRPGDVFDAKSKEEHPGHRHQNLLSDRRSEKWDKTEHPMVFITSALATTDRRPMESLFARSHSDPVLVLHSDMQESS
jgi:hypothetical protein